MRRLLIISTLFTHFLICSFVVSAENTFPASAVEQTIELPTIEVSSNTDIDWKPYRTMLNGLDAFEQYHELAPASSPRFVLRPQQADLKTEGVTLSIVGAESSIEVPVASNGVFELPRNKAAADENADLAINARKGAYQWRPYIRSPNLPADLLRLGDLRLECEMRWAVEKDSLNFSRRSMLKLLGGPCRSSMVKVMYPVDQKLIGVTLVSGTRNESLPLDRLFEQGRVFSPPLHDQTWPNDTLVELRFAAYAPAPN